ncbi:MAG: site-specific DNA-methyltransferase [candidate division Zixibacteria bacterium]|nr:site-specific DNA-methyltransferase [candidate division Zixibacteria bacterium]
MGRIFDAKNKVTLATSDCLRFLRQIPDNSTSLVVTSPPYNIGKSYERKLSLQKYTALQARVISESIRILKPRGSLCWVVGNLISKGNEILPLDLMLHNIFTSFDLKLRNRIVWHFEHGLNCSNRFSGRYETILWYTPSDTYTFNLDNVRVPQKYPGKRHYKGPKKGEYSGNPLGKNPGDVWVIPNVKANHVEKTVHPCQFPIALVETLILALTNRNDLVVDPFMGVGSTAVAASNTKRRVAGCDRISEYTRIARSRVRLAQSGDLKTRPRGKDIHVPDPNSKLLRRD